MSKNNKNMPKRERRFDWTKPVEPVETNVVVPDPLPVLKYPHKYMWAVRGVPMHPLDDSTVKLPPMNLPVEAQNSMGYHLELAGFVHVSELETLAVDGKIDITSLPRQWIKHRKPEHGPDIPINPGTWVRVEEPDENPNPEKLPAVDLTGVPDAALEALKEGIRQEEIRKAKLAQADPAAKEAEKIASDTGTPLVKPQLADIQEQAE